MDARAVDTEPLNAAIQSHPELFGVKLSIVVSVQPSSNSPPSTITRKTFLDSRRTILSLSVPAEKSSLACSGSPDLHLVINGEMYKQKLVF